MMESEIHHSSNAVSDDSHHRALKAYYRYHATIYDWTRWCFLFGRVRMLDMVPGLPPRPRVLEIGCGTGSNLLRLNNRFPEARICGVDLSPDMIRRANDKIGGGDRDRVELINGAYGEKPLSFGPFDLVLLSYSLSMFGERAGETLKQIHDDLAPGGYIAVIDFHTTPFTWFRRWMKFNHVALDGHLPPVLCKLYDPVLYDESRAYFGLWNYFHFLGRRS